MTFERFTKIGGSYSPKISIRTNGQLGFSQGAVKKFDMKKYGFCQLYFDQTNKKIGLRLSNEDDGSVSRLYVRENNCFVSAKTFMDYYDLAYDKTQSFIAYKDPDEDLIIIDLNKPMRATKGGD